MNQVTTSAWPGVVRGVAYGDAWGYKNEFQTIEALIRDNPVGPSIPKEMIITDDTQMTLYLAAALDESWDKDMATVKAAINEAFLAYAVDPDNNRAPGNTVMGSLRNLRYQPDWTKATSTTSDGSGTVMRTTPTAFQPEDRWVGVTAYAAAVTHGTANAIAAAILNAAVLRAILAGKLPGGNLVEYALKLAKDPEKYGLTDVGEWLDDYQIPGGLMSGYVELARLLEIARDNLPQLRKDPWGGKDSDPSLYIGGGGWRAHETLVIALMAVDMFDMEDFKDSPFQALRRSVVTDGDSDTIGAVAGGLLGAMVPDEFMTAWKEDGDVNRFEDRYIAWIENEADQYAWVK